MDAQQIEKLVKLQNDITKVREAFDYMVSNKDLKATVFSYHLPLSLVENLKEEVHAWIMDQFLGKALELEQKLEDLTICRREQEEKFTPANDI